MMEVEDQIESIELATSKPINSSRVVMNRRFQMQKDQEREGVNFSHNQREISNPAAVSNSNFKT